MKLKKGDTFYMGKQGRKKYHVVAILDEPEKQVVLKYYGINKRRWWYEIKALYELTTCFECELYSNQRIKKWLNE